MKIAHYNLRLLQRVAALLALALLLSACGQSQKAPTPPSAIDFRRTPEQLAHAEIQLHAQRTELALNLDPSKPLSAEDWEKLQNATPEELQSELKQYGDRFLYGPGLGTSMTNIGAIAVFPPYAIYLLGNAGLSLAGFQQLYITSILPESPRKHVLDFYDGVTSVPGRLSALVAGKEYQEPAEE